MKEIIDFETTSGDKSVLGLTLEGATEDPTLTIAVLSGEGVSPEVLLEALAHYEPYVKFLKANYKDLVQNKVNKAEDYVMVENNYGHWRYVMSPEKYKEPVSEPAKTYVERGIIFKGKLKFLTYVFLNCGNTCEEILTEIVGVTAN